MRKKVGQLVAAIAAFLLLLPFACDRSEPTSSSSPDLTPTPTAIETSVIIPTAEISDSAEDAAAEPEPASPPEEADASDEIGEELAAVATRTPLPTPESGPVTELVEEFTAATGLDDNKFLGLTVDDWINLALSALFVMGGFKLTPVLLKKLLRRIASRSESEFWDGFWGVVEEELKWLAAVLILSVATQRLEFLGADLRRVLTDVYFVLGLLAVVRVASKLLDFADDWYKEHITPKEEDKLGPALPLLHRVGVIVVYGIAAIIGLGHFGIDVTALSASLGIAGLALSLAAQDTISDAIQGFIILIDQPFRVGDRIEISGLGTWGDVVSVGMRTTRIRTRDNRMVIVPNSLIGKDQVVNYTFPDPTYRIQMDIGIGYGMDIERTRQIIVDAMRQVEGVLEDKPVDALYNEMGASAMTFRVRWWIESYQDKRHIYDRANTVLQEALDKAGVKMPFTTYDVNLNMDEDNASRLSQAFGGDEASNAGPSN